MPFDECIEEKKPTEAQREDQSDSPEKSEIILKIYKL